MAVTQKEQTKPCEISLEIEVETEKVKKAFDAAYREAGKVINVPGFRKGKAPRSILERFVDEDALKERVAEKLVQEVYEDVIKEAEIDPFGTSEYEIVYLTDGEPFKFKAKIPLAPEVKLGKYQGIKVDRLAPAVSDEDIQREIDSIRERAAKVENVEDRPVQKGDLAIVSLTDPSGQARETVVEAGGNLPSFDEGLVGMSKGDTKTIEIAYPDDYEDKDLAGTASQVVVTVNDIKSREIPEMTDELVKQISEGSEEKIETVGELKDKIKSAMEKAASDVADRQVEQNIVEKVIEGAEINYPEVMVQEEVRHRFQELLSELKTRKMTLEEYLEATGRTFDQLSGQLESASERDIKVNLVLYEVAKAENIEATEEDVEAEIGKMAQESGMPVESIKAYMDKTGGRSSMESRILRRKVLDFLAKASNIKNVGR